MCEIKTNNFPASFAARTSSTRRSQTVHTANYYGRGNKKHWNTREPANEVRDTTDR